MDPTPEGIQNALDDQMVAMIGHLFGVLLTGVLLTLGVFSVPLLSSKGDQSILSQNRILRGYIIILSLAILALDAEAFVLGNGLTIFFSRPQDRLQEFSRIMGKVVGSTTLAVGLMANGILVCLP